MRPIDPSSRSRSSTALALGLLCLSALTACTTTTSEAMSPKAIDIVGTHPESVVVHAQGTARRMGIGPPFVSSEALQEAVEEAVLSCELFGAITTEEHANYALRLKVTEFEKPESALDMTASIVILWSLRDARTRAVLWTQTITTAYTANTIHTGILEERLQRSIEGAVRENIELGLQKLSALELPHADA